MCSHILGQGVLPKYIGQGVLPNYIGQGVLRRHISKEPSNASLMCSPFFGQGVLQECGKHSHFTHFTHLKLKQQFPGQYDNFFFTVYSSLVPRLPPCAPTKMNFLLLFSQIHVGGAWERGWNYSIFDHQK